MGEIYEKINQITKEIKNEQIDRERKIFLAGILFALNNKNIDELIENSLKDLNIKINGGKGLLARAMEIRNEKEKRI